MKKILMSAMILILLLATGCEENNNPPPENDNPPKVTQTKPEQKDKPASPEVKISDTEKKSATEVNEKTLQVKIYYPDDAGMSLIPVTRQIKISKDADKYYATALLLTEKPKEKNLTKIFPERAKINGVILKGDTAVVNFDSSLVENFVGGSTGEEMLINSIVQTLTEFPEVAQVRFLVDGYEVETLSGHMDLTAPISRN